MIYGDVCAGLSAPTVAWAPLGWKAAWYSEIEPFPCRLLKHHYPDTPKWLLAKWIISHFAKHRIYDEPMGGGDSVLMRKPRVYAEVYNDIWETVVNVFLVLRDPAASRELERPKGMVVI